MDNNHPKFYDDAGTEINPDLVPKPDLCISCRKDELRDQEHLCDLTRMDQQGNDVFVCEAYEPKDRE